MKMDTPTELKMYRIRRDDGLFFGARKWGVTHSANGKFYESEAVARAALPRAEQGQKDPGLLPERHELVEYDVVEVKRSKMEAKKK